ncbi:peptidase domain-containing ABC transporter [Leptolyngbya sp. FACHB-36]|uniref:type I secretion system permease/ATPase n=1 Tax=Leptolyngbya sp. FACHB-36 TaxID=2692808 RepID=UPI00168061F0|nr:peptidase domain-containing ABC transporter [Leptolyngbya sp. FACHB-36]MBD2022289.1 peptidase domain-containing ABC transporter [Leptolyngbya sp. FACHB-36]
MFTTSVAQTFLSGLAPFQALPERVLSRIARKVEFQWYEMGQPILQRDQEPTEISLLYQGQARSLGHDPDTNVPVTLQRLEPEAVIGWSAIVRGIACETVIASTDAVCLALPASEFLTLLEQEDSVAVYFHSHPTLVEVFDLLSRELNRRADRALILEHAAVKDVRELAMSVWSQTVVHNLTNDRTQAERLKPQNFPNSPHTLHPDWLWLVSGGMPLPKPAIGSSVDVNTAPRDLETSGVTRLIGIPATALSSTAPIPSMIPQSLPPIDVEPGVVPESRTDPRDRPQPKQKSSRRRYPHVSGRGPVESTLACFQMLAQQMGLPFRRDMIRKVLTTQYQRTGSISLPLCGAVAELMGLSAQLVSIPVKSVSRLQTPALIRWQNGFGVLYEVNDRVMVVGVPERGVLRRKPQDLLNSRNEVEVQTADELPDGAETTSDPPNRIEVLLLQPTRETPKKNFGLSWFMPSVYRYRWVLLEVLVVSVFVQLFGLANPLMTQVIIDKVLVQKSLGTLQVLGIFLVVIAVFEAILSSLRTYLFVDTTNRIDLTLGSEIINHLLRLPLRYFERRPVGELASRMSELENIRQFLTTTALTVVLDAIFSVIYIVVMFAYSWVLALVALSTLPLFAILTALASPIVRRKLRTKAERHSETQSYLVEVLSGIQTVKAQNIELRSRWQWQERYAKYVSAGFKTVLISTIAGSTSHFLSQLSSLMVLWAGAYLVLEGNLTLGQLIAFRIIAGYVTSPLLRLTQLWQNFQETALSLERLSDILDTPPEADDLDRQNIPLPSIQGTVTFDNVSFRFNPSGPLQLCNVNLEFPAGSFVGIVGQSGSGKSTLMKLLPRLYPLDAGRILVDGYDISKVELYSLRRQIGIVPQDTLLFDGTIQENIALNHPDASSEEIIRAAQVAAAHDFIMNLPNGYNTRVGERGSALSGGQRQRIAIARTVLQNPRLLILDEATSALDYESERQVCLNLAEALKGRTVFFITHRLSTIRNADVILMMDQGIAVEQGNHDDLMSKRGRYYCLYRQQESQL